MLPHHPLVLVQIADDLITTKSTGVPRQIAQCLGLSERVWYYLLDRRMPIFYFYRTKVGIVRKSKIALLFLSFFLLGFGSEIRAQESVDKEVKPHDWEIGLDIRPFFDTPIIVGVMVKRSLKDKTKAIRFRTVPRFYNSNNKTYPGIGGTNFLNGSFDLGIEKRKQSGKFVFYYGSDLRFIYRLQASNVGLSINQQVPALVRNYDRYIATGVAGIIGGKFFLNHRLSLSAESSLSVIYGWTRREMGTVDYNLKPINLNIEEVSGVSLALDGIAAFMISYHF